MGKKIAILLSNSILLLMLEKVGAEIKRRAASPYLKLKRRVDLQHADQEKPTRA